MLEAVVEDDSESGGVAHVIRRAWLSLMRRITIVGAALADLRRAAAPSMVFDKASGIANDPASMSWRCSYQGES
jgi:hypothetical protein